MPSNKEMIETISESFNDACNISKSSLQLALNRAKDLNMNPILVMLMLKVIVEVGLKDVSEKLVKEGDPMGEPDMMEFLANAMKGGVEAQYKAHLTKLEV